MKKKVKAVKAWAVIDRATNQIVADLGISVNPKQIQPIKQYRHWFKIIPVLISPLKRK